MLTPYELGKEVARIQICSAKNATINVEKAAAIAHLMGIMGDQQTEFLEGYQNNCAEIMRACDLCGGGVGEDVHTCPEIPSPSWLPGEEELAEAEREMRELEESLQAGKEMIEDETRALKAEMTHGAYYL